MTKNTLLNNAFLHKNLGHGNTKLKNVFIKSATFEGMYKNGIPTDELTGHHVNIAKGEVAMTTISYGAVSRDARTFDDQMYIHEGSLHRLEILAQKVHAVGGKVSMQLTHCGYFTKNKNTKKPMAPSKVFNEYGFMSGIIFSKAMSLDDMKRISDQFANAALEIKKIGFDAVEIHMGHGYLLSQFLSPYTNKRKDQYGGTIENRARFPLELLEKVTSRVGKDFPVLVKLNLSDGFRTGFSIEDCKYVCEELSKTRCAAIVLSGGFTSKSPFYLLRGGVPLVGMIKNGKSIFEKLTMAIFGPLIIKKYKYQSNFFLDQAKVIRKHVNIPLVYLGGVDSKIGIEEILEAKFEFIGIARALIHDSNFLLKIKNGSIERSACTRCNKCIVEMDREGVKCVL